MIVRGTIKFWPYDEDGELDALMEFDNVIMGIEVKYLSGLSSDDSIDYSETPICTSANFEKKKVILS